VKSVTDFSITFVLKDKANFTVAKKLKKLRIATSLYKKCAKFYVILAEKWSVWWKKVFWANISSENRCPDSEWL
jgi:hypothetical protein